MAESQILCNEQVLCFRVYMDHLALVLCVVMTHPANMYCAGDGFASKLIGACMQEIPWAYPPTTTAPQFDMFGLQVYYTGPLLTLVMLPSVAIRPNAYCHTAQLIFAINFNNDPDCRDLPNQSAPAGQFCSACWSKALSGPFKGCCWCHDAHDSYSRPRCVPRGSTSAVF